MKPNMQNSSQTVKQPNLEANGLLLPTMNRELSLKSALVHDSLTTEDWKNVIVISIAAGKFGC